MADTDPYQADNSQIENAQAKTAQAAATQKSQQQTAETPRSKPASQPAAKPAGDQSVGQKAKSAVMNTPVAQGVAKVLGSFKKGGEVPETGNYKLHEGEEVVPNNGRASEYRKVFKSRGDAGKHSWGGK
jgi:hypothetical protein